MPRIGKPSFTKPALDMILVCDQKTAGSSGGTSVAGTQARGINTELVDTGNHCTISSNQIILLAGTYRYEITAPAINSDNTQCWLYNVTDNAVVPGANISGYGSSSGGIYTLSIARSSGRFTITGTKTFEIRHYITTGLGGFGLGASSGSGNTETFTVVQFGREP